MFLLSITTGATCGSGAGAEQSCNPGHIMFTEYITEKRHNTFILTEVLIIGNTVKGAVCRLKEQSVVLDMKS